MRKLTSTGTATASYPSASTSVAIQAKSTTPTTAPNNATITFCPAGIALGDMLIAENRDSLADVFYAKATGLDIGYSNNENYISSNSAIKFTTNSVSMTNVQTVYLPSSTYIGSAHPNTKIATASDVAALGITTNSSTNNRTLSATGNLILAPNQSILLLPDGNVYIGNATDANGLAQVYLGSSPVVANKVATKGYVDSAIANVTNTVITTMTIVGNVDAYNNRVYFKADGPLSSYTNNAGRQIFSDPQADENLTMLVNEDSVSGDYIRIGYAFVVTTAGTIPTPELNVQLNVGDIILFKNDYPEETTDSTFKWYKI